MATQGERLLGGEWIAVLVVITGDQLGQNTPGGPGSFKLVNPSRYFATVVVYLFLAALALVNDRTAKFAATFGALVMGVVLLTPTNPGQPIGPGNRPLVVRFFNWLAALYQSGPTKPPGIGPSTSITPNDASTLTIGDILSEPSTRASNVLSTFGLKVVGSPSSNLTAGDKNLTIAEILALPPTREQNVLSSFGLAQQ